MLDKNSEHQPKRQNSVLISQIINDVKRDLSPLIVSNRAEIYLSGNAEFEWNPTEIRLVFQNLVSNAIKYAKKGIPAQINIVITDTSSHLNITVSDNGIGISEDTQSIIFNYRSKGNLKQDKASFGIGLSHCKEIVTDLGGRIWVKSAPDKGSEFHLEFPKQ
jgi:signal transduction histidine kinase